MRAIPLLLLSLAWPAHGLQAQPDVSELIEQLKNRSCAYSVLTYEVCKLRPLSDRLGDALLGWLLESHQRYECPLGAARCLQKLGPKAAEAVPALLKALRDGPDDFDTGDGIIGVRSGIAAALAATRDPRAIDALGDALEAKSTHAEGAIVEALGSFGPPAGEYWQLVAERLKARNRDRDFSSRQREQFERSLAVELATQEIRGRQPGRTSFSIPQEEVESARRLIDRTSASYIRDFESRSIDHLASVEAKALGNMRRREASDALLETLSNPHAAGEAALALGNLGNSSPQILAGLESALVSSELGPRAKSECARTLGKLGSTRSLPALREALRHEELAKAAGEALGALGGTARAALPDLMRVALLPSLVVKQDSGMHWSVEASGRADVKRAAVRAVFAIDPAGAPAMLAPLRGDPDTQYTVRSLLRRAE